MENEGQGFNINQFDLVPEDDDTSVIADVVETDTRGADQFDEVPEESEVNGDVEDGIDGEELEPLNAEEKELSDIPLDGIEELAEDADIDEDSEVYIAFGEEFKSGGLIDADFDLTTIKDGESLASTIKSQFVTELAKAKEEQRNTLLRDAAEYLKGNPDVMGGGNEILNYTSEDLEDNEELSKQVITEYYKTEKDLDDRTISTIIKNEMDLEGLGKELHAELLKADSGRQEQALAEVEAMEATKAADAAKFHETVYKESLALDNFIPGVKVDKTRAKKLQENIPDVLQKIENDLTKYGPLLALMDETGFLDGKFDTLISKGESRAVGKLDKLMKKKASMTTKTGSKKSNSSNKFYDESIAWKTNYIG